MVSLLIRTLIPSWVPTFLTSSKLNDFPNAITLQVEAPKYKLQRDTNIQSMIGSDKNVREEDKEPPVQKVPITRTVQVGNSFQKMTAEENPAGRQLSLVIFRGQTPDPASVSPGTSLAF